MALRSMTGFSRVQGTSSGYVWAIEMKSVNGRGLDLRFRLPPSFDRLEPEMRARAQKVLARGSISITVSLRREVVGSAPRINEAVFAALAEKAEQLAWSSKLNGVTVGDLLRLPGVIETGDSGEEEMPESVRADLLSSFDAALADLLAARTAEGATLAKIVSGHLDEISASVVDAAAIDVHRPQAVRARLDVQIAQLLGASERFDSDRLHQEAMLIAARIDVREEIDRLKAHVDAGRTLLGEVAPVGRKLDFLTQEFVREANTLCSKANDIALTRVGLALKSSVEQLREQVQNIE